MARSPLIAALLAALLGCWLFFAPSGHAAEAAPSAEKRALAFLAAEVPKWARENRCYTCHNNGDAVRALAHGLRDRVITDSSAIQDTLNFLNKPASWHANGPEGPFKDKRLARIQFAAALAETRRCNLQASQRALGEAAALVAELQAPAGFWESDTGGAIGSPVTYGRTLATAMTLGTLTTASQDKYEEPIRRARAWLEQLEPKNVLEASSVLWGLADDRSVAASRQQERALAMLARGESPDGGWGPFVDAPPEVFDTALALVALARYPDHKGVDGWIRRGRSFLLERQQDDGSWPATTRPAGGDSYAGQLSTTAWATQALLATHAK
jgi:hypothetical protein